MSSKDQSGVNSLLALAVMERRCDVFDLLLSAKADLESKDDDGNSLLLIAAMRGNKEVVLALLNHGADVNSKDKEGKNIFDKLFLNGHYSLAQHLWESAESLGFKHEQDAMQTLRSVSSDVTEETEGLLAAMEAGLNIEQLGIGGASKTLTDTPSHQHDIWLVDDLSDDDKFSPAQISQLDELIQDMLEKRMRREEHAEQQTASEGQRHDSAVAHAVPPEQPPSGMSEVDARELLTTGRNGELLTTGRNTSRSIGDGFMTTADALEEMMSETDDGTQYPLPDKDPVEDLLQRLHDDRTGSSPWPSLAEIRVTHTRDEDLTSASELLEQKEQRQERACRRVTNGFALLLLYEQVIQASNPDNAKNARADCDVLVRSLPQLGFPKVDLKSNLTRASSMSLLQELSTALRPDGNLDDSDCFLLYVQSLGSPGGFWCSPDPRRSVVEDFQQFVYIKEIIELLCRAIPDRPKIIMLNLSSPEHTAGQDRVFLSSSACKQEYHEDSLSVAPEVTLVTSITRGRNHWITNSGSIFQQRLVANLKRGRGGVYLDETFKLSCKELRSLFIERLGTGTADCEIGIAAYESFYVQKPLMVQLESSFRVLFGPPICFSQERTSTELYIKEVGAMVCKRHYTESFTFSASEDFVYISSVHIDGISAYGWEFHLLQVEDNLQVHVGAVQAGQVQEWMSSYGASAGDAVTRSDEVEEEAAVEEQQGTRGSVTAGIQVSWMLDLSRNSLRVELGVRVQVWYDRVNGRLMFTIHDRLVQKLNCPKNDRLIPALAIGKFCLCEVKLTDCWIWK